MAKSFVQKIIGSLIIAVVFLIISAPYTYDLTNKLGLKTTSAKGCPSTTGLIIHTVVFFVIIYLIMLIPMGKKY